jgi:hypothetical protein
LGKTNVVFVISKSFLENITNGHLLQDAFPKDFQGHVMLSRGQYFEINFWESFKWSHHENLTEKVVERILKDMSNDSQKPGGCRKKYYWK